MPTWICFNRKNVRIRLSTCIWVAWKCASFARFLVNFPSIKQLVPWGVVGGCAEYSPQHAFIYEWQNAEQGRKQNYIAFPCFLGSQELKECCNMVHLSKLVLYTKDGFRVFSQICAGTAIVSISLRIKSFTFVPTYCTLINSLVWEYDSDVCKSWHQLHAREKSQKNKNN